MAIAVELEEVDEARVAAPLQGKLRVRTREDLEGVTARVFLSMRASRVEQTGGEPFGGYRELAGEFGPSDWEAGEHVVPFALPAIRGPASYRGRALVLAWSIVFELRDGSERVIATRAFPIAIARRDADVATGGDVVSGYREAPRYANVFEPELGSACSEGVRAQPPRSFFAKSTFDAQLEATPPRLAAGSTFDVTLFVFARARTPDFTANVTLVHREVGTDHGGRVADELAIAEAVLTSGIDLPRGHSRFGARLAIPNDAAPSYADPAVVTEWLVRAVARAGRSAPVVIEWVLAVA